ncbi:hypothetical protein [Pyxidicoccus caerfyrddinensis]|uniref:hypothetical protein n=1 Tax=Pyxidicoccus caerfyrddinensis TaxID=2709663 RepID=UPI0013DB6155|nr:hypothetical protein [Pyxidicoccus caerfyrddinensis]
MTKLDLNKLYRRGDNGRGVRRTQAWLSLNGCARQTLQLMLLLVTASCGQVQVEEAPQQFTTPVWSGASLTLTATRAYSPTRWEDGVATLDAPLSFLIPKHLPVVLGNSGNHRADLRFRLSGAEEVVCEYQGGSDKAHPETTVERARAHRYVFRRCSNGLESGQSAQADWFQLHLHNGDHKDPARITQLRVELGGNMSELEPPISPEESVALRDSFSWASTSALPEQNLEGQPALYYALVYVEEKDQVDALDEMLVHYSPLPLFSEEFARWQGQQGTFGHEGDGQGQFLFTLMPAATYNLLRKAALEGEPIYRVIALRDLPAGAQLDDGSVSYQALRESGFLYRGLQPADVETWGASEGRTGQPLLNQLRRAIVRGIAKVVTGVVRLAVKGIGVIDRWGRGSIQLDVEFQVFNTDRGFDQNVPMQRAWGEGAGQPVVLPDLRISVWQFGTMAPALYTARTGDTGAATLRVARGRPTTFCMRLENDAAVVTRFLLGMEFCDFQSLTPARTQQDVDMVQPLRSGPVNVLAQASEGRAYLRDVAGYTAHKAVILIGGLASLSGRGEAVAPCLNMPSKGHVPYVVAVSAALSGACETDDIWKPLIAQAVIAAVALAGPAYAVDIILPDDDAGDNLNSRGVLSHEYGHFTLCSMLYRSSPENITVGYTDAVMNRLSNCGLPGPNAEAAYLNEAFADFMSGQFAGGVNYFVPPASNRSQGMRYCPSASGACMDANCGALGQCLNGADDAFDRQVGRVATLLHDAFDGRPSLPPQNAPGNADVWSNRPMRYSTDRRGSSDDERVALPGTALFRVIQRWDARGALLRQNSFLGGLSDAMAEAGVSWCDRCRVFALHDSRWDPSTPNTPVEPLCQSAPIRDWIGPGNCSGTWTPWLNRDAPSLSGDWESLVDFLGMGQACPNPLGIECQTVTGVDWTQTGQVYTCEPTVGGICRNVDQTNGTCFDYRVRFLCP